MFYCDRCHKQINGVGIVVPVTFRTTILGRRKIRYYRICRMCNTERKRMLNQATLRFMKEKNNEF